jgi:glycosyltransferase involved in cell wall biosynthesis
MDKVLWIFLFLYTATLGVVIGIGYFLQLRKEYTYRDTAMNVPVKKIKLEELVVIIPFRNEIHRIQDLLNSIQNSKELPKEFVFVDDHSSDKGMEFIASQLKNIPHRIIQMKDSLEGKKKAIRFAIESTESEFILSMDADVTFSSTYFSGLKELSEADMYLLPAILRAKKWYEHVYEVDLILVNAVNCGITGWKRPILASGANLLYKRESFVHYDRFESHAHMPSGDDIYLLRDFRNAAAEIRLVTDTALAIHTETPQSFKEFIHQRLRWIAKTGDVKDHLSTVLAIFQIFLTFAFVALLLTFAFSSEWKNFLVLYVLKTSVDLLLFLPYFNRIKRLTSWLFIPFYEILFPFYSLLILGMMYFFKPVWKGRNLETNY